jgi:hypothetical protein
MALFSRRSLAWVLGCTRIAGQACHILRTDQKQQGAAPFDGFEFPPMRVAEVVTSGGFSA